MNDLTPLNEWPLLSRDTAIRAVNFCLELLNDGHVEPAKQVLDAFKHRLDTDAAVMSFWEQYDDEGENHILSQ